MSKGAEKASATIAAWEADRSDRQKGSTSPNATLAEHERDELRRLRMENAELLRKLEIALRRGAR